jgi:probable HAF family extracellular repeat protein
LKTFNSIFAGAAVAWMTTCGGDASLGQSFVGLGDLPGGIYQSVPYDVSDDGSVVVGRSRTTDFGDEAFRWTQATGMVRMADQVGGHFNTVGTAYGVSADGSVIVGVGRLTPPGTFGGTEAFRWTEAGGFVGLGDLPGGVYFSEAIGVSADGAIIAGSSSENGPFAQPIEHTVRWSSGMMANLGGLGGAYSYPGAISGDGSTIIGISDTKEYRWTQATGMVALTPGDDFTTARFFGLSHDGSVMVGGGNSTNGFEAFRWTQAGGFVGLGDLPGGAFASYASAVSGDGSIIVGTGRTGSGDRAAIWDAAHGMRDLRDVLVTDFGLGASLDGWVLTTVQAISSDGKFIVGYGTNPNTATYEAWLANLTTPSTPDGNFNGDAVVDGVDLDLWSGGFGAASGADLADGDADGDGDVDGADFLVWQRQVGSPSVVSTSAAVPEPATWMLIVLAAAGICVIGGRMRQQLMNA